MCHGIASQFRQRRIQTLHQSGVGYHSGVDGNLAAGWHADRGSDHSHSLEPALPMWTLWVVGKSMSLSRAARAHGLPVSHLGYQKSRAGAAPAAATSLQIAQGRLPKDTDCTGCQWHAPGQLAEHLLKPGLLQDRLDHAHTSSA